MKLFFTFLFLSIFILSCNPKNENGENISGNPPSDSTIHFIQNDSLELASIPSDSETKEIDAGKIWLENIFKCKNKYEFCFYLETEEEVSTDRFYQFMIDSEQIYGASNLEEHERFEAIRKYKSKWSKTYPLRTEETGEPWLFGRGQDDMINLKDVKITKISDLKYRVFIHFYDDLKTESEVTLVPFNNSFKIDFCKTEFLD